MAIKTKTWDSTYEATPPDTDLAGNGNLEMINDRVAVRERLIEEHEMNPAGAQSLHGLHKEGSARVYTGTANPTLRPNGSDSIDSNDDGRVVYLTDTQQMKVYCEIGSTWGWYNVHDERVNQSLLTTASPTFVLVNGDLNGTAYKIRTSAPASPAVGDIWIQA